MLFLPTIVPVVWNLYRWPLRPIVGRMWVQVVAVLVWLFPVYRFSIGSTRLGTTVEATDLAVFVLRLVSRATVLLLLTGVVTVLLFVVTSVCSPVVVRVYLTPNSSITLTLCVTCISSGIGRLILDTGVLRITTGTLILFMVVNRLKARLVALCSAVLRQGGTTTMTEVFRVSVWCVWLMVTGAVKRSTAMTIGMCFVIRLSDRWASALCLVLETRNRLEKPVRT